MRRLKKKANASTVEKAPENVGDAAETVVVNAEVITDKVISQSENVNDTTNGMNQLENDAVIVHADGVNVLEQDASGEEMNKEIVDGEARGDGEEEEAYDPIASVGDGDGDFAIINSEVSVKDENGDPDEEGDEDDEEGDENGEEAENVDDHIELENENVEEDEDMENVNKEEDGVEDAKSENVAVGLVNVGKEEVKEDNTMKEGVDIGKEEVKVDSVQKVPVKNQNGRSKKKGSLSGNMNGEKKISGGASGQADITVEHKVGQSNPEVVIGEADGEKEKEKTEGVGGGSSNQKRKKSKKKKKKKTAEGGPNKEATTKQEDTQELLPKGKSNKAKSMGMIFMCNTKTKDDCFRYKVFGLPSGKRETVEKIYKGMRLFLYDVNLKLLYGIYKAASPGGYNIQPKAFSSRFPSQVEFTVLRDCLPVPEEKFKEVLKDNYYTKKKFETLLTSKQVKDLCALFPSSQQQKGGSKLNRSVKRKPRERDEGTRYPRYERERAVIVPPARAAPRLPPRRLPHAAPPPPPPYAYDRAFDIDGYRREALEDPYRQPLLAAARRDDYRQQPLLAAARRDDYRQQPLSAAARRDDYNRQPLLAARRDDYNRQPLLAARHDDYRQRALFVEDPYRQDVAVQRLDEYNRGGRVGGGYGDDPYISSSYRERVDPMIYDDGHTAAILPEYRSVRPRYRYY